MPGAVQYRACRLGTGKCTEAKATLGEVTTQTKLGMKAEEGN